MNGGFLGALRRATKFRTPVLAVRAFTESGPWYYRYAAALLALAYVPYSAWVLFAS